MRKRDWRPFEVWALYLIVLVAVWVLWPGVTGPFLFDDFPNLGSLKVNGGVHDAAGAIRFIFGNGSGPGGRPLSMATFLLNDNAWPSDPRSFKITNIWIHALNGILVFCLLSRIRDLLARRGTPCPWLPLLGSAIWLFHPIQTTAIFLVVQRMTLLFSLFALLTLLAWLKGRDWLLAGRGCLGLATMAAAIALLVPLAVLCKETAVTIPLSVWALEFTMAPLPASRSANAFKVLFFFLPTVLCLAYLAHRWGDLVGGFNIRAFGPWQRVVTELTILPDYLYRIFVPHLTVSIYNDDMPPVDLHHIGAAQAALLVVVPALLVSAFLLRRSRPVYAFGILFYFAGQWLESGPLSLELYFLHRNYLPLIGPVCALVVLPTELAGMARRAGPVLVGAFALLCAGLTHASAFDWGDQGRLALDWANEHPNSPRAQMYAAQYFARRNDPPKALSFIEHAAALEPHGAGTHVSEYTFSCIVGREQRSSWDSLVRWLPSAAYETSLPEAFGVLYKAVRDRTCTAVTGQDIIDALAAVMEQDPAYRAPHAQAAIALAIADMFQQAGDYARAVGALEYVNKMEPSDANLSLQVHLLLDAGQLATALEKLEEEKQVTSDPPVVRLLLGDRERIAAINREQATIRRMLARRAKAAR